MNNRESYSKNTLTVIIVGASGDLAKRKIFPGLFLLYKKRLLPEKFRIIGYARSKLTKDGLIDNLMPFLKKHIKDTKEVEPFFDKCSYMSGSYSDFSKLNEFLGSESDNRLFYLSLPPNAFLDAAKAIGKGCKTKSGWNRIVVEKPFGRDYETFRTLSQEINKLFNDDEIYRMDHYLGKEVVQNLLVLRFSNVIFDPLWSRSYVQSVHIVFKEKLGVEGRGGYFDNYGIIRDVMQNHMMQILALLTMEPPVTLNPKDIRDEKVKVLRSIKPPSKDDFVVGQYIASDTHIGYRDDPTVDDNSTTPTFASCVLKIRNRRWDGVPFLFKCGKGLNENLVEIRLKFKNVPGNLFGDSAPNEFVIRIQPDESIYMNIMNKVPGLKMTICSSLLEQKYTINFANTTIPDAYERLLQNIIVGDKSNFVGEEELNASWKIFDPILKEKNLDLKFYKFGSQGPSEANDLATKYNTTWFSEKKCYVIPQSKY